jgi:DNA-binding NarL/FixJ family response regulator
MRKDNKEMNTTLTILLITQNPAFQDSLEQTIALLQADWHLEHARSLDEALKRYGPSPSQTDPTICSEPSSMVILLDPHVQEELGLQVIKRLLSQLPAVPIVQLLQPEEEELGLEGVKVGAQDYLLLSTLTPMKLHRTIRDAIRRHDVMQRLRRKRQTKPIQEAGRRPINVLWISKNSKDSRLLKSLFARAGEHWNFLQVATLLEAIALYHCNERLNLQPVTIDVALLDISQVIPQEMDVLAKFQQAMPDLPIIGLLENELSLYGDCIQAGFIYLVKDEISITQLFNTIQSVLQPTIA